MTEAKPYHRQSQGDWDESYDMLLGPDGFECLLTEREDRTWYRDGAAAVRRLNEQHVEIDRLRAIIERLEAAEKARQG